MYTVEIEMVFSELLRALGDQNPIVAERAAQLKIYADYANGEAIRLNQENVAMRQQLQEMQSALDSAELAIEDM